MKFLFFFSFYLITTIAFSKELVDKIVASVSSDIVLQSELKSFSSRLEKPGQVDETLLLGAEISSLKNNPKEQLDYLVRERIIESEIKRLGLGATDSQVDNELAQMAKRGRMSVSDLSDYLKTQGFTLDEYRKSLKARIERHGFFEKEIISKLRITDEDALSYFQSKNPKYQPSIGEFTIAQIFFSAKKGGLQEALARAKSANDRLSSGEKFDTLANQLDETPSANQNGFLGTFKSGEFLPEIERAVGGLNENQVSGILKGPAGFHIVKLISKKTVLDPEFIKVKENIKNALVQQNFERQLKNWFELKKMDSNLKVYENAF